MQTLLFCVVPKGLPNLARICRPCGTKVKDKTLVCRAKEDPGNEVKAGCVF